MSPHPLHAARVSARTAAAALLLVALTGCPMFQRRNPPGTAAEAAAWMTGVFSSAAQAAAQPDDYLDVQLVMRPIWSARDDGPWLYVEQALASALEQPYRQRVYHLVDEREGLVRSDVYELPGEPLDFAGAWADVAAFDVLAPDDLLLREGCSIRMGRLYWEYSGATEGEGCASSLRGAAYARSQVSIQPLRISSWDQGFDADGEQVWGAEPGPYLFDMLRPFE